MPCNVAGLPRSQQAMRAGERRFRDLVEGSLQGILIHRDGTPVYANRALATLLGYDSPAELLALGSMDRIYATHEQARLRGYRRVRTANGDAPSRYEFEAVRKDGGRVVLETHVRTIEWEHGIATQHTLADITQRRLAEAEKTRLVHQLGERVKELTALRDVARLLHDNHRDVQGILDGVVHALAPAWQHADACVVQAHYGAKVARSAGWTHSRWRQQARFRTADGVDGTLEVRYLRACPQADEGPFLDEERGLLESVAQMLGSHFERRRAEHALRRYEHIVSASRDMMCFVDRDCVVRAASRSYADALGLKVHQLVDRPLRDVVGEHGYERRIAPALERTLCGLHHSYQAWVELPRDGIRFLDVHLSPYPGDGAPTTGAVIVTRDRTEHERFESALRVSEQRFRDFAEVAADWFWETDAEARVTYVSGRLLEVTGLAENALLGHSMHEHLAGPPAAPGDRREELLERIAARSAGVEGVEVAWVRADGDVRWLRVSARAVFEPDGRFLGYRGTGTDISEEKALAGQLVHLASHDDLTGLANRRTFERCLTELVDPGGRADGRVHAVCYLDLDQFKVVNDTCGHVAGDRLLGELGEMLRQRVRRDDVVARLGGDEFALLLRDCEPEQAYRIAGELLDAIGAFSFAASGRVFRVGASIGLVPFGADGESVEALLARADAACYTAKDGGRNRIHVSSPDDEELARRSGEMEWVSRIHAAVDEDRFRLFGQPIVAADPARAGERQLELLIRMRGEDGEDILPGAFLPAAERYNLSGCIDRWVVDAALRWLATGSRTASLVHRCWINLSALSVSDERFADYVVERFRATGVDPARVCFEITETAAIGNLTTATRLIERLHALGCRLALDDFGSGLSSYGYLKALPVDYIKIDGQFVRDVNESPISRAVVRSINEIGHVMGKRTVAEFVEDGATRDAVAALGVDYAQGYGILEPVPLETLHPTAWGRRGGRGRLCDRHLQDARTPIGAGEVAGVHAP